MTPPKIQSVDISATENLHLEVFKTSFQPGDYTTHPQKKALADHLAKQLEGSDLYYDPDQLTFLRFKDGQPVERDIYREAQFVETLRNADKDQDGNLTVPELQGMLIENFGETEGLRHDTQEWMREIQSRMEKRYRPIAKNMLSFRASLKWQPTLSALQDYHKGLFYEDLRQSQSFLYPDHAPKILGNGVLFLLSGAWNSGVGLQDLGNRITGWEFLKPNSQSYVSMTPLDQAAEELSFQLKNERELALVHFERALSLGEQLNLEWYQNQDIEGALDYMANVMAKDVAGEKTESVESLMAEFGESAAVLKKQTPLIQLHKILTQEDPEQVFTDLLEFAKAERPETLGIFGGGNTQLGLLAGEDNHWYNPFSWDWKNWNRLNGARNNYYFANSVFAMYERKRLTENDTLNETLKLDAAEQRSDMLGVEGGGWSNLIWGTLLWNHETRDWSDVQMQNGVGEMLNLGIWFFQGPKILKGLQDIRGLKYSTSPHGLLGLFTKWLTHARPWNPLRGMGHPNVRKAIETFNQSKSFRFYAPLDHFKEWVKLKLFSIPKLEKAGGKFSFLQRLDRHINPWAAGADESLFMKAMFWLGMHHYTSSALMPDFDFVNQYAVPEASGDFVGEGAQNRKMDLRQWPDPMEADAFLAELQD